MENKSLQERVEDLEKVVYFKNKKSLAAIAGRTLGWLIVGLVALILIVSIIGFASLVWNVFQGLLAG